MNATHSTKLLTVKAKQSAVCADIITNLPKKYVSSKTTEMTKKYWACPKNGAEIKKFINVPANPQIVLPPIESGLTKQILVPLENWQDGGYVCLSPLPSLGVLHEMWLRPRQHNLYAHFHTIQPNARALVNHGELMLKQGGCLAYLKRGKIAISEDVKNDKANAVQIVFNATNVNVFANQLCIGHPAISAVGGLVHNIERNTDLGQISFAFGFCNEPTFKDGGRGANFKKTGAKIEWAINTEITANGDYVLLLDCDDNAKLYHELSHNLGLLNRFCGGSTFDIKISLLDDESPVKASYVNKHNPQIDEKDSLEYFIKTYKSGDTSVSLNQCGYALLEEPTKRKNSRNYYPHAWAESISRLVQQGGFNHYLSWWNRYEEGGYFVWD